jgi:hypothetical protein
LYKEIVDKKRFYTSEKFVIKILKERIQQSGKSEDPTYTVRLIMQELQSFRDNLLAHSIIPALAKEFNILPIILLESIRVSEFPETVFYQKFLELLTKLFTPLGYITKEEGNELVLWSNTEKKEITLNTSKPKDIANSLASVTGSLYTLIKEKLGIPHFLAYASEDMTAERLMPQIENDLRGYISNAVLDTIKGLPLLRLDDKLMGGIFYLMNPHTHEKEWYYQNGKNLFIGEWGKKIEIPDIDINSNEIIPPIANPIYFRQCDTPLVNGHYFNSMYTSSEDERHNNWSTVAISEEAMNATNFYGPTEIFDRVYEIFKKCFSLKHEVDYTIMTLYVMYTPIYHIFMRRILLNLIGETSSGKSRIGEGIFGGKISSEIQLVENVLNVSHYTEAGARQVLHNKGMLLVLEEFEDSGQDDTKSNIVRKILDTLRTAETKTRITKGTPGGEARQFTIDNPVMPLSVRPMTEAMDMNRFLTVSTKKTSGMKDQVAAITQMYLGREHELIHLKHSITVNLCKYSQHIQKIHKALRQVLDSGDTTYKKIPYRTLSQLIPLMTIYSLVKGTPKAGMKFLDQYLSEHSEEIAAVSAVGHTSLLWSEFFRSACFKEAATNKDGTLLCNHTLISLLRKEGFRQQLCTRDIHGIRLWISPEKDMYQRKYYLIISWHEARIVFPPSIEFARYPVQKLKITADRDPNTFAEHTIKRIIGLNNWQNIFSNNKNFDEMSVIEVTDKIHDSIVNATKDMTDVAEYYVDHEEKIHDSEASRRA